MVKGDRVTWVTSIAPMISSSQNVVAANGEWTLRTAEIKPVLFSDDGGRKWTESQVSQSWSDPQNSV